MKGRHRIIAILQALMLFLLFLCLFSGQVNAQYASVHGNVVDEYTDEPIADAVVVISYLENGTIAVVTGTDVTGYFEVAELQLNTYNITIEAEGYRNKSVVIEISEGRPYEINIPLEPEVEPAIAAFSITICFQLGLILTIVLIISLVMYSKIRRENLLDNAVRKRIFDYIRQNPGKHYRAILTALDLPMGVLSYHLSQLEKGQYILSIQEGKFTRYYPRGPDIEVLFRMSDIQESILSVVKENQGISQTAIAGNMGVSRKVINYHVNILNRAGLIAVKKHGRESACYPMN